MQKHIFHPAERGRGIGSWAIKATRDFAFEKLKLHRLELDVFLFNPSAEKAYQSAGFKHEEYCVMLFGMEKSLLMIF
ncbi:MAG: GNAT family protein [Clostridiales bacterium]|uniref:GNAT family N-acetyltransferase n=1 Tax=Zhenhengia sp. TaxID=2944208 RepID=UPI0029126FFF|nr:GNAT family protein [Clostridiales bacterium]